MFTGKPVSKTVEGYDVDDYIRFVNEGKYDKISREGVRVLVKHITILEGEIESSKPNPQILDLRMGFMIGFAAAMVVMLIGMLIK